jgi:hypothetical protein
VTEHDRDTGVGLFAERLVMPSSAAAVPSLAAPVGIGPFVRIDDREEDVIRKQPPVHAVVKF